ncbi:hypothetical protein [Ectothiorhodospira lacustris]|uniref:hypothetical protein n=1 Tax=Ectothiorhodospira lacustris TaxID=2899127 RepID=UPI001EE9084F|nr:hypothetical protein [Ectothiorhodospira lacustris]MCG5501132.1 hypothetical protein [Ectothiorhodospira lacustris]MCG5511226.1 hypothetical protein [Ectothiorhodospira lacustris]MCG5522958.1 hypothetical protein [Ectothiorhodospira lacustris]
MPPKVLQLLLVLAAVLCTVGITWMLARGSSPGMPDTFEPPGWISTLRGLAGGPGVQATDLRRDGAGFPQVLHLSGNQTVVYEVLPAPGTRTRRLVLAVEGQVRIRYEPVQGQRIGDESVQPQIWPDDYPRGDPPAFIIYDQGGQLRLENRQGNSRVRWPE